MDLTKYQKIFTQESSKYLDELDGFLIKVENQLDSYELWSEIHGKLHSIKGMAKALSLHKISELSHSMESWCKQFQSGEVKATGEIVQLIFEGGDLLRYLVARKGEIESERDQRWYDAMLSSFKADPAKLATHGPTVRADSRTPSTEKIDYVKVKYSLIEELLGLSQEIMLLERSLPPLSLEQISMGLKNWIDDYTSMLKGLHFRLAQLRLVSVGDFADIFVKTIRNLAKENNKEIEFNVLGGNLEADITLLERLREPLVHIIRNCIVHGIETPEARAAAGKPSKGKITLDAKRIRDNLYLKIHDDGRGINRDAIVKFLKAEKFLTDDAIAKMSEDAFFETILSPNFTSLSEASEMAGRGIGMSVVAQAIGYLGGSMSIDSKPGRWTEISLKLPLSLSVIHTVTFKIGPYTLSIPTSHVDSIDNRDSYSLTEEASLYDLRQLLGVGNKEDPAHVLKLKPFRESGGSGTENGALQLAVDSVVGNKPLMVMPVGELLAKAEIFSGVGILENGELSILLAVENLANLS
jgi:two-component system chemotaxis sensor kinase CheA